MSPVLAVWVQQRPGGSLEAAWSLPLEVCGGETGNSPASAGDEEVASLAIPWPGGGWWLAYCPALVQVPLGLFSLLCSKETWQREWGKERSEPQVLT